MSSKNGSASSSPKGKAVAEAPRPTVDQLGHVVADINLDSSKDHGQWQVQSKKSKNKGPAVTPKAWGGPQHINSKPQGAWSNVGGSGNLRPALAGDGRWNAGLQATNKGPGPGNSQAGPTQAIRPPLQQGGIWAGKSGVDLFQQSQGGRRKQSLSVKPSPAYVEDEKNDEESEDDESDDASDSDSDVQSDDFDSDCSQKSHETQKNCRWFKKLFDTLNGLTNAQLNEPERQWHCPACQGGPGAIDWYPGLLPLMAHAKTKGGKRMKLHREFAELLDEELHRRGTSVIPTGEAFGKWKGLAEEKDRDIIWPPMVMIMNTILEKDDNDKWIGMGNQELLDYFSTYAATKSRHSYGPQGHRGNSVLIFEGSAMGYLQAERLHKHFEEQGTDRDAWDCRRQLFYPGGKRQLYGFMAIKDDLNYFNQHSHGKMKLKFELKSYLEYVVEKVKQMSEDNQQLVWLKGKVVKEQRHSKALEQSFSIVTEKLRKTMEENRIVRQRTKMQHEENKEEMDFQEKFFKDQIDIIHKERDAKEDKFEELQQKEREKVSGEHRADEVASFIKSQDKDMEEFVAMREKLTKLQTEKKVAMKKRHGEEEVELEKEFNAELNNLMEQYTPQTPS